MLRIASSGGFFPAAFWIPQQTEAALVSENTEGGFCPPLPALITAGKGGQ